VGEDNLIVLSITELQAIVQEVISRKNSVSKDYERNEVVVTLGQVNRAEMTLEKWFEEFDNDVIAQLNFIDKTTFGYLDSIPKKCGIKIITSGIKTVEKDICKRRATRCGKDRPHFEIINITKIHQRWIGSESSFIIEIGTDLKTDALGRCTHTIRRLSPDIYRESIAQFDFLWKAKQKRLREKYGNDLKKTLFYKAK